MEIVRAAMIERQNMLSRRGIVFGGALGLSSVVLPNQAHAVIPFLLGRFLVGTAGRAAIGAGARAAAGGAARSAWSGARLSTSRTVPASGRNASASVQQSMGSHLARTFARQASDIAFSDQFGFGYNRDIPGGAEVAHTVVDNREFASFVCGRLGSVPVVHAAQIGIMDYATGIVEAKHGYYAPFEMLYPIQLIGADGYHGFNYISYATLRGQCDIRLITEPDGEMYPELRLRARMPHGTWTPIFYRRRPLASYR